MNELNCKNRTLFAHDCLDVLSDDSTFPDDCIDLIYLDPPFNSKSKYNLPFPKEYKKRSDLNPVMAFNDTWSWNDECTQHLKRLEKGSLKDQNLAELVKLAKRIRNERINTKDSMSAYLINMAVRLKAMHRVLKPTGSIYLHCDPTASHYLKLLMDNIFGKENFRNEIVWQYFMGGKSENDFARKHDVILRYSKSDNWTFNLLIVDRHLDYKPSLGDDSKLSTQWKNELGYWSKVKCPDVWPIKSVFNMSKEYLGYPTQKPLALLERIIKASSNEGDVILDPFCGCGTTVHAAEELGRNWVGIDISQFSNGLVRNRLRNYFPRLSKNGIEIRGNPITLADALALAKRDRFEFEKWVCGEIGADGMYHAPGSRGADGGVDGIIPFYHTRKGARTADQAYSIVQVKSGKVTPDNVKALPTTIKQHKDNGFNSICGVFVCFEKYMRTVENNRDKTQVTDFFINKSFDYIQPISVEALLKGELPSFPGGYRRRVA